MGVTDVTDVTDVTEVTDVTKYLIAFSTVPGIGAARLQLLIKYFGSASAAWKAPEEEIKKVGLPKDVWPQFLAQRKKLIPDQYLEDINKRGVKFLTIFNPLYPPRLKNISDPPLVLYIRLGDLGVLRDVGEGAKIFAGKMIAVVGTRKMTAYGREVTEKLTGELSAAGFTIVSGMALGVDGVAHGTAINCGGKTIAVLGAGVDVIYPSAHRNLYNSILEHGGAIVSEVAPEKLVGRGIFPARNRIISGLAQAVLVTEGALDSGSLITARAALEQGREVFAVPGPINSQMAEGTNYLIKQGAKLVSGVEDILGELGYLTNLTNWTNLSKEIPRGETEEEQRIIDLLAKEQKEFDELARETKIAAGKLGAVLANLEIRGVVKNYGLTYSL